MEVGFHKMPYARAVRAISVRSLAALAPLAFFLDIRH